MHCVRVYPHTARKVCAGLKDCVKFNSSYHQMFNFFFADSLAIFPAVMNYLQTFQGNCYYFFLLLTK